MNSRKQKYATHTARSMRRLPLEVCDAYHSYINLYLKVIVIKQLTITIYLTDRTPNTFQIPNIGQLVLFHKSTSFHKERLVS